MIETIAKTKNKYRPNGDFETTEVLTDIYEHLINNIDKMSSDKDIQAFTMRYMTNQIVWQNSKLNRVNQKLIYTDIYPSQDLGDDNSDLVDKIQMEIKYTRQKLVLFDFHNQLPTKEEKILFDVIFNKGKKTIRELQEHFKVNKRYLGTKRAKLFADLKNYIEENKEKYEI